MVRPSIVLNARSFLSGPYNLSEAFRTGALRGHPKATSTIEAFADSYRSRITSQDDLMQMVDAYLQAKAKEDTETMATLEPQIAQALLDRAEVLGKVLKQARKTKKIDLNDPINRLRLSIGLKYGNLSLGWENTTFEPISGDVPIYDINPLAYSNPTAWLSLLQASFFAALDRSYANNESLFGGRDCLDRKVEWGIAIRLYIDDHSKKLDQRRLNEVVFHKHYPKDAGKESVPDQGVLRLTFREYLYSLAGVEQLMEIRPTPQEIRLAKKKGQKAFRECS